MNKKKPVVAVVMGILHLLFAGYLIVCNLCGGGALVGGYFLIKAFYQQASPAEQREMDELWQSAQNSAPWLITLVITELVVKLLMGLVLLIAGVGVLRVRNWARWLSVIWAVVCLVVLLGLLVLTIAYVNPAMEKFNQDVERWSEKMQKRQRPGQPPPPTFGGGGGGNSLLNIVGTVIGSIINLAYPVAVLIVLLLPATGHAFARYNSAEDDYRMDSPPSQDYYDEDYERQRRELPPPTMPEPPPP